MGNIRYYTKTTYSVLCKSPHIVTQIKSRTSSKLGWETKHILNFTETTSEKAAKNNSEGYGIE